MLVCLMLKMQKNEWHACYDWEKDFNQFSNQINANVQNWFVDSSGQGGSQRSRLSNFNRINTPHDAVTKIGRIKHLPSKGKHL